jgi:cysteinyl-tRNA synthetase
MLQIYNSLTRKKEPFKPIKEGHVSLYVCGMTVYDFCHIGHARVLVAFDIVTRYLHHLGYAVTYVRNITDIDDKIIQRAQDNQEPYRELTERFIRAMHEDLSKLGISPPTVEPRATDHITSMLTLIQSLIEKGFAYVANNGDVHYRVRQFKTYGALAQQDLEKLQAGVRVAVTDAKQDPLDFVLWKLAKADEPSWPSPWGAGRPGWHIECSAMSMECLGKHFDIHGGGLDLTFPHHENEIAQSEASTNCKFVNTWMHVGFVQVNQEKMSKSLGNFFTIREVLNTYAPEVIRYFLMASHYRSPLNYTTENLESAKSALERFYLCLRDFPSVIPRAWPDNAYTQRFEAAMSDDFNTPVALSVLFDLVREIYRLQSQNVEKALEHVALLKYLSPILGFLQQNPEDFLRQGGESTDADEINRWIQERLLARENKDFAKADQIRAQLAARGVVLEDGQGTTRWRRE